jgi:urease gamma subunit
MAKTTDDEARDDIIKAARMFLKEVLASKGRRTDVESNAFWAAAVALIPADVLVNRKGRAVVRLLDINYRVIKKASEMRGVLDYGSRRWATVKTSSHSDVSEWSLLINWLHISQKFEGSPQVSWTLRDALEGEIEATFPEFLSSR